ncbi:co-chaperone YbbN [Nocardioides sp. CPCC 205120]|uniref:co-chaperone YbbN n=1 Tax=Nocardioides sp. CPCC 205120 TaxID=3406462 RepID=UPI003B507D73
MTQRPFSRPGAIDLSVLKRPAGAPAPGAAPGGPGAPGTPGAAGGAAGGGTAGGPAGSPSPYATLVDEQSFQTVLEASRTAAVLLVFFSRSRMPESGQLADDVAALSAEFEGRFLVGLVDIDATPQIAQAMQIPSIPLVVAVLDGRPMPLFQDVLPLEELRAALTQVVQQLAAQGITQRHQPLPGAAGAVVADDEDGGEPPIDPRYLPAQEALEAGDNDRAVAEYEKLLAANPADAEAATGLARAKLLRRTATADLQAARAAAAERADDVDAQILVADLDVLGGHVDDAFARLVEVVRRTAGDDKERVRQHLVELFGVVGNADPRVARARQQLASALF